MLETLQTAPFRAKRPRDTLGGKAKMRRVPGERLTAPGSAQ